MTGLFKRELDLSLVKWSNAKYWSAKSIETKLDQFLAILNNALERAIPKKKGVNKSTNIPLGGIKISHMRAKLRKVAKNKTPEGRDSYTSLRREYKKAIKTTKSE